METVLAGAGLIVAGNAVVASILVWRYQRERNASVLSESPDDVIGRTDSRAGV